MVGFREVGVQLVAGDELRYVDVGFFEGDMRGKDEGVYGREGEGRVNSRE